MEYATIHISGSQAAATASMPITAGTVGGRVKLSFDEGWEGFQKTLVWQGSGRTIDDINCTGIIPAEVLTRPYSPLVLGVYGTKEEQVLPTVWVELGQIQPGADPSGDETTDPALPIWAQLEQRMEALEEKLPDLSDYVKKDYLYGKGKPGLMTIPMFNTGEGGLIATNQEAIPGGVIINAASKAHIDAKANKHMPIVPNTLDYAVKSALTSNSLTLTAAEKAAVRAWLGL